MAILKIARMGHPVLRHAAHRVEDPTAPEIKQLIADMLETLEDIQGAGLAAPQVHHSLRLVIFSVPTEDGEGLEEPTVLINPEIEILSETTEDGWEGCLSVPGLRGVVPRYTHIRYSGVGTDGSLIEREAEGFHARVVQHECDHLDGILYLQRMTDLSKLIFESETRYWIIENAANDESDARGDGEQGEGL